MHGITFRRGFPLPLSAAWCERLAARNPWQLAGMLAMRRAEQSAGQCRDGRCCCYCGAEPAALYVPLAADVDRAIAVWLCADCPRIHREMFGGDFLPVSQCDAAGGQS
jgi:hypothetical protein